MSIPDAYLPLPSSIFCIEDKIEIYNYANNVFKEYMTIIKFVNFDSAKMEEMSCLREKQCKEEEVQEAVL